MKIKEYLGWDKHTGDLIGFVDLGDPELKVDVYQILYGKEIFIIFEVFILFTTLKHRESNGYYSCLKFSFKLR